MFSNRWSIGNHCNLNILLQNCKPVLINPVIKKVCREELSENWYLHLAWLILSTLASGWAVYEFKGLIAKFLVETNFWIYVLMLNPPFPALQWTLMDLPKGFMRFIPSCRSLQPVLKHGGPRSLTCARAIGCSKPKRHSESKCTVNMRTFQK